MYHVEDSCTNCPVPCRTRVADRPWSVLAYAVIQQQGELVLVRRRGTDEWTLPGGPLHADTSLEDSLRVYVLGQTGMEIFMRFSPHVRECPARHHFLMYREAVPACWSGKLVSREKSASFDTKWHSQDRLPLKIARHARSYLVHERNLPPSRHHGGGEDPPLLSAPEHKLA